MVKLNLIRGITLTKPPLVGSGSSFILLQSSLFAATVLGTPQSAPSCRFVELTEVELLAVMQCMFSGQPGTGGAIVCLIFADLTIRDKDGLQEYLMALA